MSEPDVFYETGLHLVALGDRLSGFDPVQPGLLAAAPHVVAFATRDARVINIDAEALWRAERVAVQAVARETWNTPSGFPDRSWSGAIVADGQPATRGGRPAPPIICSQGFPATAVAVNSPRGVLAVAEETETPEGHQLRLRSFLNWAERGSVENKPCPVWVVQQDGTTRRVAASGDVQSIDIAPDGSRIALLEWSGDPLIAIIDVATCAHRIVRTCHDRRLSESVDRLDGNERIAFSPDAQWLLVSGDTSCPGTLVHTESGVAIDLPLDQARGSTWWPRLGPSTLLLWSWTDVGDTELASYDLATRTRTSLGPIRIFETPGVPQYRRLVSDLSVAPDGQSFLCTTFFGPSAEHQDAFGSSPRWAIGRIGSNDPRYAAEIIGTAPWSMEDDPAHELIHRCVQWTGKGSPGELGAPVRLHPSLLEQSLNTADSAPVDVAVDPSSARLRDPHRSSNPPEVARDASQEMSAASDTPETASGSSENIATDNEAIAIYNVAVDLHDRGDLAGARAAYTRAIETRRPAVAPGAGYNLGLLLLEMDDPDGARRVWQHVIDDGDPDKAPKAAFNLARLLGDEGDVERSCETYELAVASGHAEVAPQAAVNLGQMRYLRGDVDGATEAFEFAIASGHPNEMPRAAQNLGALLAARGDSEGAARMYELAIRSGHPESAAMSQLNLGNLLLAAGETTRARASFEEVMRSEHPAWAPRAAMLLGTLHADEGQIDEAREAFSFVIRSGHPGFVDEAKQSVTALDDQAASPSAATAPVDPSSSDAQRLEASARNFAAQHKGSSVHHQDDGTWLVLIPAARSRRAERWSFQTNSHGHPSRERIEDRRSMGLFGKRRVPPRPVQLSQDAVDALEALRGRDTGLARVFMEVLAREARDDGRVVTCAMNYAPWTSIPSLWVVTERCLHEIREDFPVRSIALADVTGVAHGHRAIDYVIQVEVPFPVGEEWTSYAQETLHFASDETADAKRLQAGLFEALARDSNSHRE